MCLRSNASPALRCCFADECSRGALNFDFSGRLCDALVRVVPACVKQVLAFFMHALICIASQDECYPLWHKHFTGKVAPDGRWAPWRSQATKDLIAKKDAVVWTILVPSLARASRLFPQACCAVCTGSQAQQLRRAKLHRKLTGSLSSLVFSNTLLETFCHREARIDSKCWSHVCCSASVLRGEYQG